MGRFFTCRQVDTDTFTGGRLRAHVSMYQSHAYMHKICGTGDTDQTDAVYMVIFHSGKLLVACKELLVYLIGFVVEADGENNIKTSGERD